MNHRQSANCGSTQMYNVHQRPKLSRKTNGARNPTKSVSYNQRSGLKGKCANCHLRVNKSGYTWCDPCDFAYPALLSCAKYSCTNFRSNDGVSKLCSPCNTKVNARLASTTKKNMRPLVEKLSAASFSFTPPSSPMCNTTSSGSSMTSKISPSPSASMRSLTPTSIPASKSHTPISLSPVNPVDSDDGHICPISDPTPHSATNDLNSILYLVKDVPPEYSDTEEESYLRDIMCDQLFSFLMFYGLIQNHVLCANARFLVREQLDLQILKSLDSEDFEKFLRPHLKLGFFVKLKYFCSL